MKIGIDVDNTITNTLPILKAYCRVYNEEVIKRNLEMNEKGYTTTTLYNWTPEENFIFCKKYIEEIVLRATIKNDAQKIVEQIKNDGNEIYIITARNTPYFTDPYKTTKEFLDVNNIVYDKIIVNCTDKYTYCLENNIDIMMDDEPKHINSISKMIPVIAFEGMQNEDCQGKNIIKVNTWEQVYKEYQKLKTN